MGSMGFPTGSHGIRCSSYPVATTERWQPFAIESRFYRVVGFRAEIHLHYLNCSLGKYFILVPSGVRL